MIDFPVLLLLYSMAVTVPGYETDPHDACWIENERQQQDDDVPNNNSEDMRDRIINQWIRRRPIHKQSDCLFAFLVCSILILLSYLLITETTLLFFIVDIVQVLDERISYHNILLPVFTRTLLYSIIALHSLKHPDQQQNINFFPIPGKYVPLFHVVFGLLMGYRINETIHGLAVGFLYAWLVQEDGLLASMLGRKRLISTPHWLVHLVGEDGIEGIVTNNGVTANGRTNANTPYPGINLEPGSNFLHHAASIGDITFIQSQIDQVESATTAPGITAASAPFRQQDRNGWQPIHEASRAGKLNALKLLLEVDGWELENGSTTYRRRAGKLKIDVNARTNRNTGFTALRLVEDNHGTDNECAELLRGLGGVSLGLGDGNEGDEQ